MRRQRVEAANRLQDGDGAIAVLNTGAMNHQGDHETIGVGNDMALAALDLLARIKAARAG